MDDKRHGNPKGTEYVVIIQQVKFRKTYLAAK